MMLNRISIRMSISPHYGLFTSTSTCTGSTRRLLRQASTTGQNVPENLLHGHCKTADRGNKPWKLLFMPYHQCWHSTYCLRCRRRELVDMAQPQHLHKDNPQQSKYWMRAVSFAGLHRILKAVASSTKEEFTASEINNLVRERNISLTQRDSAPSPTTLYHYRNTLLHLHVLRRNGRMLRINKENPDVRKLIFQPAPTNNNQSLNDVARGRFAALVLNNEQCRSLFFDLFMPLGMKSDSVSNFRAMGLPVKWVRKHFDESKEVIFENEITGRRALCSSPVSVNAILYGLRYWARNELNLIDEYCQRSDGITVMFPIYQVNTSTTGINPAILETINFILSLRSSDEWTLFSISDLITNYCQNHRLPISVLFGAVQWLLKKWPHHTVLIPTSRALATLTATSPQRDILELRRYYKVPNGPYISHIRIHKDITIETETVEVANYDT